MGFKHLLTRNIINIQGWSTNRKIIVIESDDWGSIRMPSTDIAQKLLNEGIKIDKSPYCLYDKLESSEDLEILFSLLSKYIDYNGKHPVITANVVTANPDFDKIAANHFENYYYESVVDTFDKYYPNNNPFKLWIDGFNSGIFFPQFHGREHVNVPFWLKVLKEGDRIFNKAFEMRCWGISTDVYPRYHKSIQASFDFESISDINFLKDSLFSGLNMFEKFFGYKSRSFIPNNFIWPNELNEIIKDNGVMFLQGMKYQLLPKSNGNSKRQRIRRISGKSTQYGLTNLVRNVHFEPSCNNKKNSIVKNTISEIKTAFFWKKPAVISIHRLNFMGGLDVRNRTQNLELFELLLKQIIHNWPDIEFLNSIELGNLILKNK